MGDSLGTNNVLCDPTENILYIASWNGSCWSGFDYNLELYGAATIFVANDTVYATVVLNNYNLVNK